MTDDEIKEEAIRCVELMLKEIKNNKGKLGIATFEIKPSYNEVYIDNIPTPVSGMHVSDTFIVSVEFYK